MKRILLTGGRAPVCLELVRNFGRNGHEVYVAESIKLTISGLSKYVRGYFHVAKPRFEEDRFIDQLINIISENKITILFPTCEEVFYISKHKERIENACPACRVMVDDFKKMIVLHDKYQFIESLGCSNVPVPITYKVDTAADVHEILRQTKEDRFVFKPVFSRFGHKVRYYNRKDEHSSLSFLEDECSWVMQEFIDGPLFCTYAYCENGQVKFNSSYTSNVPMKNAVTINFKPVESEKIDQLVKKIVEKYQFSGNISFDFIKKGNDYFVIECNPRMTSGVHLIKCNDLGKSFFQGQTQKLSYNKVQILAMMIVKSFSKMRTKQRVKVLKTIFTHPDIFWDSKDLKPFFCQIVSVLPFYKIARNEHISLESASTIDIEWGNEQ